MSIPVLGRVSLYFHTLRYLRPGQIAAQLLLRVPRWVRPQGRRPAWTGSEFPWGLSKHSEMLRDDRFHFLGQDRSLAETGWAGRGMPLLWTFHLHYFDWLHTAEAIDPTHRDYMLRYIQAWVTDNPYGRGIGWHPYPTSLRIVNWIRWHAATGGLDDRALTSLWNQIRWLNRHREFHLMGNHLLVNAKALFLGAGCFEGSDAAAIRDRAERLLVAQVREQFLSDGGHQERSPMYHALVLEDLLDVLAWARTRNSFHGLEQLLASVIARGLVFLGRMTHPHGTLTHFNDSTQDVAPALPALLDYASSVGVNVDLETGTGLAWMKASGFVSGRVGSSYFVVDIGSVGPDHQPGHAHAGTLSFEWTVQDRPVVVNSGISVYGTGPDRQWQRSTAAHSTLYLDDVDSSEVWAGFRVARRARVHDVEVHQLEGERWSVKASHDGYLRLPGRNIHQRQWDVYPLKLSVTDSIKGTFRKAVVRYYFHPDLELRLGDGGVVGFYGKQQCLLVNWIQAEDCQRVELVPAEYYPGFGRAVPNWCLKFDWVQAENLQVDLEWLS